MMAMKPACLMMQSLSPQELAPYVAHFRPPLPSLLQGPRAAGRQRRRRIQRPLRAPLRPGQRRAISRGGVSDAAFAAIAAFLARPPLPPQLRARPACRPFSRPSNARTTRCSTSSSSSKKPPARSSWMFGKLKIERESELDDIEHAAIEAATKAAAKKYGATSSRAPLSAATRACSSANGFAGSRWRCPPPPPASPS